MANRLAATAIYVLLLLIGDGEVDTNIQLRQNSMSTCTIQ
jgi:hypothetical protein